MDGKEPQNRQTQFCNPQGRSFAVACGIAMASLCSLHSSVALGQSPRPLNLSISAQPIEQVVPFDGPTALLVKPNARIIKADRSPFSATLTSTKTNANVVSTVGETEPIEVSANPNSGSSSDRQTNASPSLEAGGNHISVEDALQTRGSVTFRKTPISEVIFLLSDLWKINIVSGEGVSGEVSGSFHDAPLSEVLAAVLTSSGYSYRKTGSSLVVLPAEQIGVNDPTFVSETVSLPPALRDDASTLEAATMLLSERGQLKKIGTDLILVIDKPDRIERVRDLFQSLSPQLTSTTTSNTSTIAATPMSGSLSGISYFSPQFTDAAELAEPLRLTLGQSAIVAIFSQENRIMVKGTPNELQMATEVIRQLDKPRQQVRITAMIYDVSLSELEKLGINWSRDIRALANGENELLEGVTGTVKNFYSAASDLTTTGATSVGIRTLTGSLEASVFLEALDSNSEAKLLADPSITVGDRRQASIRIVRQIPIITANPVENSNAVFTQTQFKEAGVILNVLPRISRDGTIELNVQPEYSVVAEITASGPVIDSRTAETYVRVANGQTFVLGGLRQKSIIESQRGVPYLRDIKYVGRLFRSHTTEIRESELIVFLKPEIITPYYAGSARERVAANVANLQLDEIPHADVCPQTECCKDAYCPNHHPRPRINAGSFGLPMIGGDGIEYEYSAIESDIPVEFINPIPENANEVVYPLASPSTIQSGTTRTEELYPPVHVGPNAIH